jgi:cell wall-associated NlpC family hydrolase
VPRDADMQAAEAGEPVDWQEGGALARGDLVFWEGHVGIMASAEAFIHANAHHMAVEIEPLRQASDRIKRAAGFRITGVRHLPRR